MNNTLKRNFEPSPFHMASVEIIIPFHNEHAHVTKLIQNIFTTVHKNRYLITLVDDGSINTSFAKDIEKKKIPGTRCLQQSHKGFGAAINYALKNPYKNNTNYVCIMHSDVLVEDAYWLNNLGNCLLALKNQNVKMVSSLTNNPGNNFNFLLGEKGKVKDDYILADEYLPMYCVLANRELFNKVGLFAEYPYAGLETEDFASRMRKMNYKQAACGNSWVSHVGGLTLNKFKDNRKVQEILRNSKEQFLAQR